MALYQNATYPADLPKFWNGTSFSRENNPIATDHTMGLPRMRKGNRPLTPYAGKVSMRLTVVEYRSFRNWWKNTLRYGVMPFEGEFSLYGRTGIVAMQILKAPSYNSQRGGDWVVEFEVWSWKLPGLTQEEVDAGVIDLPSLELLVDGTDDILASYYDLENQYGNGS